MRLPSRTAAVLVAAALATLTLAVMRRPSSSVKAAPQSPKVLHDKLLKPLAPPFDPGAKANKRQDAAPSLPDVSPGSGKTNDGEKDQGPQTGTELETLFGRLEQNPNDQEVLDRLASLHVMGEFRDEIVGEVARLYRESPGSHVLAEALGTLYNQEKRYDEAAEHLRRAVEYTDRPMRVRTLLAYVELRSGDFDAARATAKATRSMLSAYLTGKRDRTLIKEELKDEYMQVPCYFEAIAAAKADDPEGAQRALATCGDGILSPSDRQRLLEGSDVEAWRDMDIDEILD